MFQLIRPCSNCPFRKGMGERFNLCRDRIEEIVDAPAFQCHNTVEYGEDENGEDISSQGDRPQQCFGLMSILAKENRANQIMQVANRLGCLEFQPLIECQESYSSLQEAIEAHGSR